MLSSVNTPAGNAPDEFALSQNYPNPFNSVTVIEYTVGGLRSRPSGSSNVQLAVCDILGCEVVVLVDEQKEPGRYTVQWDAGGLGSGVYICRMSVSPPAGRDLVPTSGRDGSAGTHRQAVKMVLTK